MGATFHIKNFDRLQHYKDRSPPWIKLYNGLLDDYEFGRLPDASKAHLLAIGLLASRHSNKLPLDAEWLGKRINATDPVNLELLIESGFVIPDQDCSKPIAERKQVAMPERETETQVRDREKSISADKSASTRIRKKPLNGHQKDFAEFYAVFPKHVAKGAAMKAYAKALERAEPAVILEGAKHYRRNREGEDPTYTKNPATWLNADCWLDEAPIADGATPDPELEAAQKANAEFIKSRGYE